MTPVASPTRSPRQSAILESALRCFQRDGYANTTIEAICSAAGASVGSVYHHFGGKDRIAATLYVDALAGYQEGFLDELRSHDDARAGIAAVVRYHLRWVSGHPELARFVLAMRETEVLDAAARDLRRINRAFFGEVRAWLAPHADSGAIRDLEPDLLEPLLLGAAQEFSRHWLAGRATTSPDAAADVLAAAAWSALTTKGASS
jgi:AcrR family transcriptional regulator